MGGVSWWDVLRVAGTVFLGCLIVSSVLSFVLTGAFVREWWKDRHG